MTITLYTKMETKTKIKIKKTKFLSPLGYALIKKYYSEDELQSLRDDLMITPYVSSDFGVKPSPIPAYQESTDRLYIPEAFGIKKYGLPKKDKTFDGDIIDIEFNGELRSSQIEPVSECIKAIRDEKRRGGLLCLPCSAGKTVQGLYIISTIARKTLIVVHTEFLANQWKERISQFLPAAKVGMIQGKKVEIEGNDIVIGTLQSLSMKDYDRKIFSVFGLIIYDECHLVPCRVFSRVLKRINCRRHIGLSATPKRSDGMSKMFQMYIGDIIYMRKDKVGGDKIHIKRYIYECDDEKYCKEISNFRGKPMISTMMNNICYYESRTTVVSKLTIELLDEDIKQRKILVLSNRRKQLEDMERVIGELRPEIHMAYYVGGMKQSELKKSEDAQIIFGTFSMASTGLDIPGLNGEILASPKSNIIQSIGRIIRKKHKHIKPVVIDIVDNFSSFSNQAKKRLKHYRSKKYDITTQHITEYGEYIGEPNLENENTRALEKKARRNKRAKKKHTGIKGGDNCLFFT